MSLSDILLTIICGFLLIITLTFQTVVSSLKDLPIRFLKSLESLVVGRIDEMDKKVRELTKKLNEK